MMKPSLRLVACLLCVATLGAARTNDDPPADWIDPATGHRVIRLSTEPGSGTLYFHDNAYSPEGDKFVFSSPSGIMLIDVTTLGTQPPKAEVVVPMAGGAYMARRSREVYFTRRMAGGGRGGPPPEVFAYHIDTRQTRKVANASRTLINADETITVTTVSA